MTDMSCDNARCVMLGLAPGLYTLSVDVAGDKHSLTLVKK